MEKNLRIKSVEGIFYKITPGLVRHSKLIRDTLDEISRGKCNPEEEIIDVPCRGSVIEKVIEWCEQHKNDPVSPDEDKEMPPFFKIKAHQIPSSDTEFLKGFNVVILNKINEVARLLKMQVLYYRSYLIAGDMICDVPQEELFRLVDEDDEDYVNNTSLMHPNAF